MHAQWLVAFDDFRNQLVQNTRDLVRIPSTNTPPTGAEKACQDHIAALLRDAGLEVDYYFLTEVEGLEAHPSYWPGRDYRRRPNVNGVIRGQGGGRSLLLTGHIDTVPLASMDRWQHDPFGAEVEAGRLYGLGAGDMKGGVAIALTVAQAIQRLGIKLKGDLLVESAVDEEFGGVNGTLAGRLRGHNADAAVILEPTSLEVYPAARGARIINLEMTNAAQVVGGEVDTLAYERLPYLLQQLKAFADQRQQRVTVPDLFKVYENPVPVWVTKITTGQWSYEEPIATPSRLLLQIYWQMMPGERREDVDAEFHAWLDGVIASRPAWYEGALRVETEYVVRFMPGTMMAADHPFVQAFAGAVGDTLDIAPQVVGAPFPCDLFAIQQDANTPALVFGPQGSNFHTADEYLDLESQWRAARAVFAFVLAWCGVADR